jgi:hypothetical protein
MAKTTIHYAFETGVGDNEMHQIGMFIVVWNQLEMLLDLSVSAALNTDYTTASKIMKSTSVPNRVDIFMGIVSAAINDLEIQKDAINCANKMKGLSEFRNDVAHGRWAFNYNDPNLTRVEASRSITRSAPITPQKLTNQLRYAAKLSNQLADIYWRISHLRDPATHPLPSPWHGKF